MGPHARSRWTRVVGVAASLALPAVAALAGCGASGGDDATPTTADRGVVTTTTSSTTGSTTTSTASTAPATTAAPTTTVPGAARWIGVTWEAGPAGGGPLVDGEAVGLTSVSGLCRSSGCEQSLDLLTADPTGDAPVPGPYVLWANRLVDRTSDGRPIWTITDALDLELPEGAGIYLCMPTADPTVQVVGFGPADPGSVDSVTPDAVWDVAGSGTIVTPDPGGYRCEVGQD